MTMQWRAFLVMFCGAAMFFLFTMLPIMYFVDDKILRLNDTAWFVQFAMALVLVSAGISGMSIVLMDTDKDKRLVQLKLAIHDGKNFVLYWNPVGWLMLFGMYAYAAVSMLSRRMTPDDEVQEK